MAVHKPVRGWGSVGSTWLERKPVRGMAPPGAAAPPPLNPGEMDWWITDRIPFGVANPPLGNTGSMDWWITDRIPLNIWAGV